MAENDEKKQFDNRQLLEIKLGLRRKLDTQVYNDVNLKAEQMREIRLGMESKLDVSKYADKKFSAEQMAQIRVGMENGVDVDQYLNPTLNAEQMLQIRTGMEQGLDTKEYTSQNYDAEQMKQIRLGMKLGLDTKQFNHPAMTAEQMKDLRLTLATQKVFDKIKEQLKGILESFLKATNLYVHFPSKEVENTMSPKITEVLNERAQEVIKERILEAEAQREPESMEEVEQQVSEDLEKPKIQDKILDNQTIEKVQDMVEETSEEQTVEEPSKEAETSLVEEVVKEENYHEDPQLDKAIKNYIQYREEIGFPMLKSQIQPTIDHVAFMDQDLSNQAEIFNQTVSNGWKALYPLKNQNKGVGQEKGEKQSYGKPKIEANKFNNFEQRDYDYDKLQTALQQKLYQPDGLNQLPKEEPGMEM